MPFAENLRRKRLERFLTRRELAEQAHVHEATISRLEAGLQWPSMKTLRELAKTLGVNVLDLATPDELAEREKAAA